MRFSQTLIRTLLVLLPALLLVSHAESARGASSDDARRRQVVRQGLDWLAKSQARNGRWVGNNGQYPTAMTAMAANSLLAEGSTTTQGRYAPNIRRAVDYLISRSRANGLIGDPNYDDRYTYGHGFAMLFLSQVLGEEEDQERREQLIDVLTRAVIFTGQAQTKAGGWGYVSAKDGNDFDEGSTTITQVQGLRGCRNAGIAVPNETIEKAVKYIRDCTGKDGGVFYSSKSRGSGRPAITAAAIACLFNAGEYDDKYVPRLLDYCKKNLTDLNSGGGHWHYTHYYYSQVLYRQGGQEWEKYRGEMYKRLFEQVGSNGAWTQSGYGPVYATAISLNILQLENAMLPIYQR